MARPFEGQPVVWTALGSRNLVCQCHFEGKMVIDALIILAPVIGLEEGADRKQVTLLLVRPRQENACLMSGG